MILVQDTNSNCEQMGWADGGRSQSEPIKGGVVLMKSHDILPVDVLAYQ